MWRASKCDGLESLSRRVSWGAEFMDPVLGRCSWKLGRPSLQIHTGMAFLVRFGSGVSPESVPRGRLSGELLPGR